MSPHRHDDEHDDQHDIGLALDRRLLMTRPTLTRRRALGMFAAGAAGAATLLALPASAGASTSAFSATPSETGGPYPADGSNGPDVLDDDGVVRRNIRSSFGTASATAAGVALRIKLTVLDAASGTPLHGAAVYLWHCDAQGRYSLYSSGITGENYLRGIQVATRTGQLRFNSIFPACYSGRWPHIHYEVYPTLADARTAGNRLLTSQIALPADDCRAVYATSEYSGSAANLSQTSLTTDMVFSDSYSQEMATMSGAIGSGYTASFTVEV